MPTNTAGHQVRISLVTNDGMPVVFIDGQRMACVDYSMSRATYGRQTIQLELVVDDIVIAPTAARDNGNPI